MSLPEASTQRQAQANKLVVIGKLGAPFGVKGWIKLFSYTEPKKNIFQYLPWQVSRHPKRQIETVEYKKTGENYIIKIPDYDTPEDVRTLTMSEISVYRDQFPNLEPGEYYWSDLEGLIVVNQDGTVLGTVQYLTNTGANDLMIVKGEKELIIPFIHEQFIIQVDLEDKKILVRWDSEF